MNRCLCCNCISAKGACLLLHHEAIFHSTPSVAAQWAVARADPTIAEIRIENLVDGRVQSVLLPTRAFHVAVEIVVAARGGFIEDPEGHVGTELVGWVRDLRANTCWSQGDPRSSNPTRTGELVAAANHLEQASRLAREAIEENVPSNTCAGGNAVRTSTGDMFGDIVGVGSANQAELEGALGEPDPGWL